MVDGSRWFRRFCKECHKISSHIRIKKIRLGFYRIYYDGAYLHECYKEMPETGYEWHHIDPRLESQKYYEEYEDRTKLTRELKNFVEGYWESLDRIRTKVYLMKHDKEYRKDAIKAYSSFVVK